jgi:signal transduction histidine kinase
MKEFNQFVQVSKVIMEKVPVQTTASTNPQKPWLLPARLFWLAGSLIALGLFIAGLSPRAREINDLYQGNIQSFLSQNQNGEIVLSTWSGSSATRAGVLQDDILLAVDDVPVTTLEQAKALLAGPVGTPVIVSVRTGDFQPRQLIITRASDAGRLLLKYGLASQFAVVFVLASEILFTMLCIAIAAVIFWYRSDDWMALFSALMITMILVGLSLPVIAFGNSLQNAQAGLWMDAWYALTFGLLILFFCLFPGGRFASPLTLILAFALWTWLALGLTHRTLLPWNLPRVEYALVVAGWVLAGVITLVFRYRSSGSVQRQQIRWIVWGAAAGAAGLLLQILPQAFGMSASTHVFYDFVLYPLGQIFKACLPLSIAFAILRYRLWNIEIVVNRLIVYGSLTVLTMLGYLGTVFVLQALFTGLSNPVVSFFATGVVAILFEPLRQRLQRLVNHWMYGERDDPYAVLTQLAGTLENIPSTNDVLPTIARTIGQTLKIPYVAFQLDQNGEEKISASFGTQMDELLSFPLMYQREIIGTLQLARRAPGEELSAADLRLIENIARQAGAAAQTVRLNTELIRSRAQIVNEREEERLRIRRDLHDELGPILASQVFKLAAARQVVRPQPEKAERLLDEIAQQSQQTVSEIRRLVHGLRPPVLDQLGLVEAVRDLTRYQAGEMAYDITAPAEGLPPLAPAVEVNAYRIVLEALNNVTRHAHASHCFVGFSIEPNVLALQIRDDGMGLPAEYRAGVGLRSMRARAEEIGGQFSFDAVDPHGTCIVARLPLSI